MHGFEWAKKHLTVRTLLVLIVVINVCFTVVVIEDQTVYLDARYVFRVFGLAHDAPFGPVGTLDSTHGGSYDAFLRIISDDRFNVYPVYEYQTAHRDDRINIILRHDVDCANASAMAGLEQKYGIKSTYYLRLHSACYDIRDWLHFYQNLEANGYEIGYHYEVVDLFLYSNDTARKVFELELAYLRTYFNIRSVASHGGRFNYQFTQWTDVSKYGVVSAYSVPETAYLTDPNPQVLKTALGKLKPGDTVQILVHPDYWTCP